MSQPDNPKEKLMRKVSEVSDLLQLSGSGELQSVFLLPKY